MSTTAQQQRIALSGVDYCYVRYRGSVRDATLKFFYHDHTLCRDLVKRAKEFGEVRGIEFPKSPSPFSEEEFLQAHAEGRVID